MIMLLEDLRLALRQICQAMGLSGNALTVIPLVVLGVGLNIVALSAIKYVRSERHSDHGCMSWRSAGQKELKVMRTVATSTFKKIGDDGRKRRLTLFCLKDRQTKGTHPERDIVPAASKGGGCDVEIVRGRRWKTAIAPAQC